MLLSEEKDQKTFVPGGAADGSEGSQPQAPLIVTLRLDASAQAHFDALRCRYFPPARLFVGAHVTMFHALPATCEIPLLRVIGAACLATRAFAVSVTGLRFLGRGVAFDLAAPEALRLRGEIASQFATRLTRQDSAPWSPHITVQNKVDPSVARQTLAQLAAMPSPQDITAAGITIWRYQGGPWQNLTALNFRQAACA